MSSLARRRHGSASGASGVAREPQPVDPAHSRVGPYQLCLELAAGGMASVYLARRESEHGPGQMVAVKLIHPHLANDPDFIEMFMDEAELASRIHHPNVCAVLDYDLRPEESYLVMEYLVGESLMTVARALERSEDYDPVRLAACVARMLADACEGLHAAHELTDAEGTPLHVVHRDVSLENVFVTYDGVAKVMDFGVAAAANKRHHTRTGVVKGKFASVAPECLKGHRPDRRADIWGIGVIAWELLTGTRLFRRETDVDTLIAVAEAQISRPSEVRTGLPAELDDIVMRALARDPQQRYATARELARDLARFSTRGGEVLTAADVAEWLSDLLPGGRERRQQILDLASQVAARDEQVMPPARASTPVPAAPGVEPGPRESTVATRLWLGTRSSSVPPPPPLPRTASGHVPMFPTRWQSFRRTGLLVLASIGVGAAATLAAQAFVQRWPFEHGSRFAPAAASARPAPAPASAASESAATVVISGSEPREIVLRIRIETAGSDAPAMVVEPGEVEPAMEASAAPGLVEDVQRALGIGEP